ncbi:MAG: DUF2293 domain-containing protein [Fimbriiglobus sp.]
MPVESLVGSPGPSARTVRTADGQVLPVPDGWNLLPPGDAGLTRRVKAAGPTWTVQEKKGRKMFSRGVWAPTDTIAAATAALGVERADPAYTKKLAAGAKRREKVQAEYVGTFRDAVLDFLRFAPDHAEMAGKLADAVTAHATPVGSGTVARTARIPVEQRAEAAVIAWMRHQTTAYDNLHIPRVKGARREVRRQLAAASKRLLDRYRAGGAPVADCPLKMALAGG